MNGEERRDSMEREISSNRSSCSGAGEPSSSIASSSVAVAGDDINAQEDARNNKKYAATTEKKYECRICKKGFEGRHALYGHMRTHPRDRRGVEPPPAERQGHVHVRESTSAAAPEQSGVEDDEDVKWWNMEAVVDQLLFLIIKKNSTFNSQNNIPSNNNSTAGGTGNEVIMKDGLLFNEPPNINIVIATEVAGAGAGAGVGVVDAIIPACNEEETVSDEKKEEKRSKKKKRSRGTSSSSSAHTCEVCGKTFAKGQSLGGHKRKHYDIQKLTNKRRSARENQKAAVERRGGHTVAAMVKMEEERMASSCSATLESHNPAPPLQSEGPSAANGARRPHDFDLNEPAAPEEEREER